MRIFAEKEYCYMTYEQLLWKKGKPKYTRVTEQPSFPLFSFQKKIIVESNLF